ncbi:hypothetical protein [Winogradskya humida]|uniref:Uncharacterized protein n=1 Tax=Winogradskya humida TaxID=113566 RepID=A0ABQ3ZU93_9ACTN|nr:hypothetical protein [Actinoplanes humidus]GIE22124.1 hypothetical protein Ahu01nite_052260 [Actinoplanes humidus]
MTIHPDDGSQPSQTPCPCGDYYCSDFMPKDQDRSQCCMYCGPYDCDVCGWIDPARASTPGDEEVPS